MSEMTPKPLFHNAPHFRDYWERGNGHQLITWAGYKPDICLFEKYAHLYYATDQAADRVVEDTYLKLPYNEAAALIRRCSEQQVTETDDVPESLKTMFLQMQAKPDWYSEDLANIGARFNMRSGTNALIILRDFTLMGGYDFAYLNKPLIFTGALKKGAVKRLKDTLEFWVHVTRENALKVNSEAYQLVVRTRLMHSYARLTIKKKVPHWDLERWGEPINTWDMIATYTGFSLVFMQGLKKLGLTISEEEERGVFHLWKYIGYLLGIPAEYLPENRLQAVEQLYLWSTLQDQADADSVQLSHALLEENLTNTIYKFRFQRKLLLTLHQSMNWFLLDEEINQRLQIPKVSLPAAFPKMVIKANRLSQKLWNPDSEQGYRKLMELGHKNQMKVLEDYIRNTPKDFHY